MAVGSSDAATATARCCDSAYQIIPRRTRRDWSDNIIAVKVSLGEGLGFPMTSGQTTVTCCGLQDPPAKAHVCDSHRRAARLSGELLEKPSVRKKGMCADTYIYGSMDFQTECCLIISPVRNDAAGAYFTFFVRN